ncbi:MAG: hypothetical protein H6563_13025 [Lewinellaceae bacterium]|nr:hypothetical protein [Lewinellaceae bacterium]
MKKVLFIFLFQADTTDIGYKIGYQIGGWLPFIVLAFILILLTYRNWKRRSK